MVSKSQFPKRCFRLLPGVRSNSPEALEEYSAGAKKGRARSLPDYPKLPSSKGRGGGRVGGGKSVSSSLETALILHHNSNSKKTDPRRDLIRGWRQSSSLRPGVKLCAQSTQALYGGSAKSSFLSLRNSPDSNRSSRLPSEEAGAQSSLRARRKARGGGGGVSKPLARVVCFFFFPSLAKVSFLFSSCPNISNFRALNNSLLLFS